MPNWCSTRIAITHNSEEKLKELEMLVDKWTSKNLKENGFGTKWLGNIVIASGVGTVDERKCTDLRCRGYLTDMELQDNQLIINTDTAYVPMLQMWVKILDKYLPDASLVYEAYQFDKGVYTTNDTSLKDKYIIDAYDVPNEDIGSDWEASKEMVIKTLQNLLKTNETNLELLEEMLEESEYDDKISIYKWEWEDVCSTL